MKRRSFLGGLIAAALTPKALLEASTPEPASPVGPSQPVRTITAIGQPQAAEICRRFAKRYQLELEFLQGRQVARFTIPRPPAGIGGWAFTAGLTPPAVLVDGIPYDPRKALSRQLKYQLAKKLEEIERMTGLRGVPPGVPSVEARSGVAGGPAGYFPEPVGPRYQLRSSWYWKKMR